ncbi:isochorismatase family protein [Acrasis kona]|uniref:Isochorismatase family protein n=1 Tax=Acrasis kona TaxID=1008807 RepID=A0AAW2YU89_9EUKA
MSEEKKDPTFSSRKHTGEAQKNLTGNINPKCPTALVIIDMINDLNFPDNEYIVEQGKKIAENILKLRRKAKENGLPVIFCNDNWGSWTSDVTSIIDHCTKSKHPGSEMSKLFKNEEDEYFVIKPKHSAFFSTTLDVLLQHLQIKTLILVGVAGNICVLFTANDAYMRDFALIVPKDCIASNSEELNNQALGLMESVLKAKVDSSDQIKWKDICEKCTSDKKITD